MILLTKKIVKTTLCCQRQTCDKPARSRRKYCSLECYSSNNKKPEWICIVCKCHYKRSLSRMIETSTCSPDCANQLKRKPRFSFSKKRFSKEQEIEFIKEFAITKDIGLRNKIISQYYGFAVIMSRKFSRWYPEHIDDLLQELNIAMIRAVEKFDMERGNSMMSYMSLWMKSATCKYLLKNILPYKPRVSSAFRKLFYWTGKGRWLNDIDPERFGVSKKDVENFILNMFNKKPVLLDEEINEPNEEYEILRHEVISNDDGSYQDIFVESKKILDRTNSLPRRDKVIFDKLFLDDLVLQEVGDELGITRERVRQIKNRIIDKISEDSF